MANRLVIVPEDLYKGMLSSAASKHTSAYQVKKAMGAAANPEDILAKDETGLNLARKQMEAAKRKLPRSRIQKLRRQKQLDSNISAKKTLYDQELRRYLRLRQEFKDRPVKVDVISGPKLLMKPHQINPRGFIAAVMDENGAPTVVDSLHDGGSLSSNPFHSAAGSLNSDQLVASNGESVHHSTPRMPLQEQQRRRRGGDRSVGQRLQTQALEAAKADFKEYVLANRQHFPVNEDGLVYYPTTGKVISTSNLDSIINRLVNRNMANAPSPPGAAVLARYALEDAYLKNLMFTRFDRLQNERGTPPLDVNEFLFSGRKRDITPIFPPAALNKKNQRKRRGSTAGGAGPSHQQQQQQFGTGFKRTFDKKSTKYFRPAIWQQQQRRRRKF